MVGLAKNRKQPVRDWMIIRLALLSGLRAGEIVGLKITDLHVGYSRSELVVRRGKGGKQRVVKLGPQLKQDLRWFVRWKADVRELHPEAFLLRTKRSERMDRSALWRRWNKHCPTHRLHDARHTNATLLLEACKDLRVVQRQLGHARVTTTAVYAAVTDERMGEAVADMERLVRTATRRGTRTSPAPRGIYLPQPAKEPPAIAEAA